MIAGLEDYLQLAHTNLEGTLPSQLDLTPKELNISGTDISGGIPSEIGEMSS